MRELLLISDGGLSEFLKIDLEFNIPGSAAENGEGPDRQNGESKCSE